MKLGQFQGQPVVLNFWASDCLPCIRELPILKAHAARQPGPPFIVQGKLKVLASDPMGLYYRMTDAAVVPQ